ncbi:type IV pilus assembly protein PilC [Bacillus mesophilus]|uniref:Type II secretion system F family protein n=1 Tax=Bacillus mesophilus TaxID=1808955 RepID=A0A6M0Q9V9_9BACI|nr:type II secretion system F family protein [Bacillus mesophilus]MBM7662323.1 type IV pilus assembly protein PilC [Bacillus mesophilus]NEY73047.1 type II secretion system F family protein [Bacillus mesophilus]
MQFKYTVIDSQTGKEIRGKLTAVTQAAAAEELKKKGLYVAQLQEIKESVLNKDLNINIGPPVKNQDFVIFCRQLATLLNAGTPIVDAISLLSEQVSSKPFQQALKTIFQDIRSGTSFSKSCAQFPKIFDRVFVNMVLAGETSGDLENTMNRLAIYYEKERKTREKVKSALIYPIAVTVVAIIVIIILLTKVLPSLLENLLSVGGEIPLPTKIVIAASDFLIERWYIMLLFIVLVTLAFTAIKRNPKGKYALDLIVLKLPVFGELIQKSILARVSRTMASLFASSVPVLQTLTMSAEVAGNSVIANVLEEAKHSLRRGESLSTPLDNSWVFPKITTHMVKIGEETGNLDTMLEKIADFYEDDVEQMASRLSAVLEPIMIAILGTIVGLIVMAAMLPMFSIYENF